ncbi:hypothetical protein [Denitrobaculum tricleocarpae]|uniref:Uncharacterized protein n=1 Tax=Denitrobaculum tricleocarpae TaxID=2591009 RepID=A0A545TGB7_9PROT|nr:hypothetical protein [Denitrobaculum tricleocarpae]TQV76267.1 hypothetical protein FKG95_21790 [Denitrobaculum tricleocarpae]
MTLYAAPSRRALFSTLLALPALGNATLASASRSTDQLTDLFSNRHSAAVLGQLYLQLRPEEADTQKLETLLLAPANLEVLAPQGPGHRGRPDSRRLKAAFQELRRRDFDQGAVVQIGGCMLSVTELRLCALMALS